MMKSNKNSFFKSILQLKQSAATLIQANPTDNTLRADAPASIITIIEYNHEQLQIHRPIEIADCAQFVKSEHNIWINVEGLKRADIATICKMFDIHLLIEEDILSIDQRPKTDLFDNFVFCLLYQLSYESEEASLKKEQISLILGKGFVLTFQEEPERDAFGTVRDRLNNKMSKLRQMSADFLYYTLLDALVDDYFVVLDVFGEKIESSESQIIKANDKIRMPYILFLRRELLIFRRTIYPARDVISSLSRNENKNFNTKTLRYLKDVYDHILQATEMIENYREGMSNMQDLHLSQANLKMNESMKVMAIVTCLLAPATVIGGVFGMNFSYIPLLHSSWGFAIAVVIMLLIPLWMIYLFKKRGWF